MAPAQSPPPLPAGVKQWEAAREKLFPHGSTEGPPLREDNLANQWQPTTQQFDKAIHRLKRQKAPDAGGWTTETAQSCLEDPRTKQRVLQWLTGQAGAISTYTGREGLVHFHKLVCLDKGNGGVRPILIGMLWTKVLSHILLAQARPDLDIHLKDRQYGIGTPQGGLAMTMAIRARLQENPDHVVASLDFKNAFCTIKRDHCLTVLRKLCPHNPLWLDVAENLLGRGTVVSYPAAERPNRTWDGLPQGDPMSALIFSTVMTETVNTALRQTASEVQALSYVDDTVLIGPADDVNNALSQLPTLLRASGLELQPSKTQVWAPRMNNIMRVPALRRLRGQMTDPRGLVLLGEALGNNPSDPFPVGEEAFIQDHLRGVTEAVAADLRKIAALPDKLDDGQAGLQVAWALLSKTIPPRVVHLLRAHPVSDTRELCETLQDQLHDTVRQCIDQPSISADQWAVARLPIQAGGLYLPHLPSLAVIARTAALATMPRASHTTRYRQNLLQAERAELFSRLRGFCHTEPSAVAGNLDDPPQGMSLRHLSRKLTQSRDSAAINAFWLRRQDLPPRLRHAWLCNLPGDHPARPASYHGHGDWLHTLPGRWETTLLDPVFRWGLQHRMGFPAPGAGQRCGRTPQGGKPCNAILDDIGRHAGLCNKGLYTRRHDQVRDHIAKVARQAGLTAQIEQKMLIPGQTQEDGEPAPGSVRPLHRADVHIIEPTGSEIWIDVRIHTAHIEQPIGRDLLREELTKCRAYGQQGFDLNRLEQGMVPVVLEQHGRTAPGAQALFQRLIHHRTHTLVRQGTCAYSTAKRQASSELWAPLSCILLRAAWQSLAECRPKPTVARPPNSMHPVRLDMPDTPQQARPTWDHPPSTQSSEDTPGTRSLPARPPSSEEFFFGARPHSESVSSPGETPT